MAIDTQRLGLGTLRPFWDHLRAHARPNFRVLHAIFILALLLRALSTALFSGMIDAEGAEYARIAQNLIDGIGYVGIATPGQQLFFPPLFPILIAALSFITGDVEIAGRMLSVVMGGLMVVPAYLIARRMYGERIALGAAALVAFHPLLIQYSTAAYCEPTYITLVLFAVYRSMQTMENPSAGNFAIMGALYGLAFLIRPEALAYMCIAMAIIVLWYMLSGRQERSSPMRFLAIAPLVFIVLAAPYVGWLSAQVGGLRLQAKSPLNIATELRVQRGMATEQAAFEVAPDLTAQGIWIQPNIATVDAPSPGMKVLAVMLARKAESVLQNASATVAAGLKLGSPALFALTVLGLFARPWTLRLALDQLHIIAILGLVVFGTFFIYFTDERFYLLFVPFLCIWATVGIVKLSQWVKRTAALCGVGTTHLPFTARLGSALAIAAIILPSAGFAFACLNAARAERPFKQALSALAASQAERMRIASTSSVPAFHAQADFIWLPYSDEDTAQRFLLEAGVTHVVLRDATTDYRPYLKKWIGSGVPNARGVADAVSARGEHLKVYRLSR